MVRRMRVTVEHSCNEMAAKDHREARLEVVEARYGAVHRLEDVLHGRHLLDRGGWREHQRRYVDRKPPIGIGRSRLAFSCANCCRKTPPAACIWPGGKDCSGPCTVCVFVSERRASP